MTHYLDHWTRVAVDAAHAVTLPLRVHTSTTVHPSRRDPDRVLRLVEDPPDDEPPDDAA